MKAWGCNSVRGALDSGQCSGSVVAGFESRTTEVRPHGLNPVIDFLCGVCTFMMCLHVFPPTVWSWTHILPSSVNVSVDSSLSIPASLPFFFSFYHSPQSQIQCPGFYLILLLGLLLLLLALHLQLLLWGLIFFLLPDLEGLILVFLLSSQFCWPQMPSFLCVVLLDFWWPPTPPATPMGLTFLVLLFMASHWSKPVPYSSHSGLIFLVASLCTSHLYYHRTWQNQRAIKVMSDGSNVKLTTVRFTPLFIEAEGLNYLSDGEIICQIAERKDQDREERGKGEGGD